MGWLLIAAMALATGVLLWRFAGFDRAALQFLAAGLLVAFAGYAWQGRPGLPGSPAAPPVKAEIPSSDFAEMREDLLGRFDSASTWLTIAESYQRRGDTRSAAGIIGAGLRKAPDDADLWVGLGNALVLHGGGMMNPAAEHAFQRAAAIAPEHPGPKFFYGLALAQGGKLDEAEALWRQLLAEAPPDADYRPLVEERLQMLGRARAMGMGATAPTP